MDILISSNLERLLYDLTQGNSQEVAGYMAQLNRTGRYEVSGAVKAALAREFAAGCCDDKRTLEVMAAVYREKNYLIDPHTAVAFEVLDQYRKATGDAAPTIVASTASPFKFCDSVLTALGQTEQAQGTEIMEQTARFTGRPVPPPLAALKDKPIRFDRWTEKEHMADQVMEMLD
jgi:threonine synthase